jgi:hypothetical protein
MLVVLNLLIALMLSQGYSMEKPGTVLSRATTQGLTVTYNFGDLGYEVVEIEGKRFIKFKTENLGVLQELGKPELPAWRDFIEVPYGADVDVRVVDLKTETISLKEKGIDLKVKPTIPPVPKIPGAKPHLVMDEKAYSSSDYYPIKFADASYAGLLRGHNLYTLNIYPVRYSPAKNELEVVTSITVEVTFKGGNLSETYRNLERYYSPYFDYSLSKKILNYSAFNFKRNPALPVVYLIVTPAEWVDTLKPLIEWNKYKGYDVRVATIPGDIPAGDTINVRNYLQNAYLNWPTPPTFVVLVGDVDRIGYFRSSEEDNPANDLKYEDLDTNESEYLPDVYVGRLSVANITQLGYIVRKTVTYEQVLWSSGTQWAKKAFFIASADPSWHQVAEGTHNYCIAKVRSYGMIADTLYAYYTSGAPTIITNAINSGRSLVIYSGHGAETGWSDYNGLQYSVSDIYNYLTNQDKYVFVQTYACLTGSYALTAECFSEAWIRAPQKGGIASLASSVTSYWDEDDILQRRVFDEWFDTGYVWIKGAINEGKLELYRYYSGGGNTHRYFQQYNLMGDPSIYVWTAEPKPLSINYPAVVPMGPSQVQITVTYQAGGTPVAGALVSAVQKASNGTLTQFDAEYTGSNGIATLNISPITPDTVFFTVTGYNLWPQKVYAIPSSSGPYVTYKTSYINEIAGNGNGRINPGETIRLYVMLKNYGQDGATNVNATLSTTNTNVTITDNSAAYGNIPAGDSTYGSDYFEFNVSYSALDQEVIPFTLNITSNEGSWSANFSYTVYAPVLSYQRVQVDDSQGNGNGVIDPGETVILRVYAKNTGHEDAPNVVGKITCQDTRVVINNNNLSMGDIPQGGNGYADFSVTFGSNINIGEIIPFGLRLTTSNLVFLDSFKVFVGVQYYATSFEGEDYRAWTFESPWARRNDQAYDGSHSLGTGPYPNNMNASLISPAFIVTGQCTLSFYEWSYLENRYDYGYVEYRLNGGSWVQLDSRTGDRRSWQRTQYVISGNPGDTLRIRFRATSDASITYDGWYIDSLRLGPVVFLPQLSYAGYSVSEVYGNGNGYQDPGELVNLYLTLTGGLKGVDNVVGYLRALDGNSDVIDSVSNYGNIGAYTSSSGDGFQVYIHPSASIISLRYLLRITGTGYSESLEVVIPVAGRYVGPCNYGYRAFSDLSPYSIRPTFNWIEIKNIGTQIANGDDVYQSVSLPFTFKFFGQNKSSITVSSNGWVGFGSYTASYFTNVGIPNSSAPNDIIAIVWDDLNPGATGSGKIYYYYDAANHIFIVEYDSVYHYGTTLPTKAQVILYDPAYYPTPTGDGNIVIQFLITPGQSDYTCGIENSTGDDGIQYYYDGTYAQGADSIVGGRAILFTTDTTGLVSGVSENLPQRTRLLGLSSNPLKGVGFVAFEVAKRSNVTLDVLDIQGRVVKTLAKGEYDRGYYRVKVDGESLPQGIYFVRLRVDGKDEVNKFLLVK